MELANNEYLSNLSKLTKKDKQSELLSVLSGFVNRAISIIDNYLAKVKPIPIEYEYIDIFAESFFSIKSFCVLMQEGLVSSASAIIRIALEQTSIVALVSEGGHIKDEFLKIKKERNDFYRLDKELQKQFLKELKEKQGVNGKKIKQYFDYGWYKVNGHPALKLEQICNAAGFSEAYDLVQSIINSFSHGQISFFRFVRNKDDVGSTFVDSLFDVLSRLFFKLVNILHMDIAADEFTSKDIETVDMVYAISADLSSRFFESNVLLAINNNTLKTSSIIKNSFSIDRLLAKYNASNDLRVKYLLSQAYIHHYRQLVAAIVCRYHNQSSNLKLDSINLKTVFDKCNTTDIFKEYFLRAKISLKELIDFLDSRNDNWIISSEDGEYLKSARTLLEILKLLIN